MQREYTSLVVVAEFKKQLESFVCGSDAVYFCVDCDTVTIESETIENLIRTSLNRRKFDYTVEGVLDLTSIPPDKRNMELGTDENPVPLVPFRNKLPRRKARLMKSSRRKAP